MALIVTKIAQLEKATKELQEKFDIYQINMEKRLQKMEKAIHDLITKLDELSTTVDAVFADAENLSDPVTPIESLDVNAADFNSELQYDVDGSVLVTADKRDEMEARGFAILGTVSKDQTLLLRMRQG